MKKEKQVYEKQIKYILVFLLGGFLVFSFYFYQNYSDKIEKEEKEAEIALLKKNKEVYLNKITENFNNLSLKASAVLIQDIKTGDILYQKNIFKKYSIASLTKIMTAILALEKEDLEKIKIEASDLEAEGEYFLNIGEIFSKNNFIDFMLVNSSNDAAQAIARSVAGDNEKFISAMNDLALKLDLKSTLFFSESGLDITQRIGGSYSNANDVNKLLIYFVKKYPERARETIQTELKICSNLYCHQANNTNILLDDYPEIIFSKTGYTKLSGGSLGMVIKENDKLFSVVILDSSKKGRFLDAQQIIEVLNNIKTNNIILEKDKPEKNQP